MFPQDGNVTDLSNITFPSSLQNTETRYFLLCAIDQFRALSRMSIKLEYPINTKKSAFLQTITFSIWTRTKMTVFNVIKNDTIRVFFNLPSGCFTEVIVANPNSTSTVKFSHCCSLQRLPLTRALKGFYLRFKPPFWWASINRYPGFSRAGLEKIFSPVLEHSEEFVGVSAVFAIFCCRIWHRFKSRLRGERICWVFLKGNSNYRHIYTL